MENPNMYVIVILVAASAFCASMAVMQFVVESIGCPPCEPYLSCPESTYTPNLTCNPPDVNTYCPSQPELPLFMKEAQSVAEAHEYIRMEYMCGDYAIELFNRLVSDGYKDVKFCEGMHRDEKHAWVNIGKDIHIEATNGRIISPRYYEIEYNEKHCYSFIPSKAERWIKSYKG